MTVYRIAKEPYIRDVSGEGARRYGGRWNKKGTSVLYTSESRSLAALEYLVHIPLSTLPVDTCIAVLSIPADAEYEQIEPRDLPDYWTIYPAPFVLADIGEEWIQRNKTLFLRVPSAVVKGEWNILVNPGHASFGGVTIENLEAFTFDERLTLRG